MHERLHVPPEALEALRALRVPAIVGISGFGGSGKSTCARLLAEALAAAVVPVDDFLTDTARTDFHSWDVIDFARLARDVIVPFATAVVPIRYHAFDWSRNAVGALVTVAPSGVLIVEGVGLFRPELERHFSQRVWIDCPIDEAIARGKRRDREEHGTVNDALWDGPWRRNDLECFERFQPKSCADLVIDNSRSWPAAPG